MFVQYEHNRLRHEIKYYINYDVYYTLRSRLFHIAGPDPHMTSEEGYLISSLYFDDMYHSAMEQKVAGYRFRKKFRIRCYERQPGPIHLECKAKFNEYISKIAAPLNREEYDQILNGDSDFLLSRPEKVCRELSCYGRTKRLKPTVVVEYLREAYVYGPGNVRITFDKDISASVGTLDMFDDTFCVSKVLPEDVMVLEVKFDEYIPEHILGLLRTAMTQQCAVSKYVLCRDKKRMVKYT